MLETWTRFLGEALLNCVWQGVALTVLAWCFLRLNRTASASTRYVVLLTTLLAVAALPVLHIAITPVEQAEPDVLSSAVPEETLEVGAYFPAASPPTDPPLINLPVRIPTGPVTSLLVGVWLALAIVYCVRLAVAYRALQNIKSSAQLPPAPYDRWWRRWVFQQPSARSPVLRSSSRVRLPLTAGLREPAIVFPASLLERLTEPEARTVWLHELAHVRRLDDWSKFGQKLVEALLFFHPAVRWLGRNLELEREIACDEWVVQQTGAARSYAACLAKLAQYASVRPSASPAPAMAVDKKQIFRRVKMIVNKNQTKRSIESKASGILIALLLLAIAGGMLSAGPVFVLADTQKAEAPPQPPEPPEPVIADVAFPAPPAPPAPPEPAGFRPVVAVAPAPPAPPEPAQQPEPAPKPKPAEAPDPEPDHSAVLDAEFREQMEVLRDEMREQRAEMREITKQIRDELREEMGPRREEMRRLSRELRTAIETEMRPQMDELRELAEELSREARAALPDEAQMAELKKQMGEVEREIQETHKARQAEIEDEIRKLSEQMKPSQETMEKFERKMREHELRMREKAEEMRKTEQEYRRQHDKNSQPSGPQGI